VAAAIGAPHDTGIKLPIFENTYNGRIYNWRPV
jgi:hypothetical protein